LPDDDSRRMDMALSLAARGWGQTSPNPMVGAVIFAGEDLVGEGFHERFGSPHAEATALTQAGERARGATLYVNLEPCNHQGRNPPCTDAIIAAGIARVVIAILDPNPVAAGGAERLRAAGIIVDVGVSDQDARELNASFFNRLTNDRPWVTLKLAVSLDGAISSASQGRDLISGQESDAVVQRMRANSDAIAVGVNTALVDDPRLTARSDPPPRVAPTRVVFDRKARLSPNSVLARTASEIPTLLVTGSGTRLPGELERCGVEAVSAHDLGEALRKLMQRGIASMLIEGGAGLAASFLAAGFAHRLVMFRAPIVLGDGALNAFSGVAAHEASLAPRFHLLQCRTLGDDVMSVYAPEPI